MLKKRKRKLHSRNSTHEVSKLRITDPYPNHPRPTPEECRAVRDDSMALQGFPPEFVKYRRNLDMGSSPSFNSDAPVKSEPLDGVDEGLWSRKPHFWQNTIDANSRRAFASLKSVFPTWEDVLAAESRCVEDAIRCGGLAVTKAACIKNILRSVLEKRGKLCLDYLRGMSIDEIKYDLCCFKGVGPQTVACVLMFHLQQDDFPGNIHVFRLMKSMGWVPVEADRKKAYLHLNKRIPNVLKFDLNCLLVTHGKLCQRCTKKRW